MLVLVCVDFGQTWKPLASAEFMQSCPWFSVGSGWCDQQKMAFGICRFVFMAYSACFCLAPWRRTNLTLHVPLRCFIGVYECWEFWNASSWCAMCWFWFAPDEAAGRLLFVRKMHGWCFVGSAGHQAMEWLNRKPFSGTGQDQVLRFPSMTTETRTWSPASSCFDLLHSLFTCGFVQTNADIRFVRTYLGRYRRIIPNFPYNFFTDLNSAGTIPGTEWPVPGRSENRPREREREREDIQHHNFFCSTGRPWWMKTLFLSRSWMKTWTPCNRRFLVKNIEGKCTKGAHSGPGLVHWPKRPILFTYAH